MVASQQRRSSAGSPRRWEKIGGKGEALADVSFYRDRRERGGDCGPAHR
jgi:hypothetical protein